VWSWQSFLPKFGEKSSAKLRIVVIELIVKLIELFDYASLLA